MSDTSKQLQKGTWVDILSSQGHPEPGRAWDLNPWCPRGAESPGRARRTSPSWKPEAALHTPRAGAGVTPHPLQGNEGSGKDLLSRSAALPRSPHRSASHTLASHTTRRSRAVALTSSLPPRLHPTSLRTHLRRTSVRGPPGRPGDWQLQGLPGTRVLCRLGRGVVLSRAPGGVELAPLSTYGSHSGAPTAPLPVHLHGLAQCTHLTGGVSQWLEDLCDLPKFHSPESLPGTSQPRG